MSLGGGTDAHLVHGEVGGQGKLDGVRYGHAWVEINGSVIDPSNGRTICMKREAYYALGKVDAVRRYSFQETIRQMADTAHYGPWGEVPP